MKLSHLFTIAFLSSSAAALACTGLIAAPGATADGSTLITYAADSHTLYGELYHRPAADHPKGTMRKVVEWDTGKLLGEIPESGTQNNPCLGLEPRDSPHLHHHWQHERTWARHHRKHMGRT